MSIVTPDRVLEFWLGPGSHDDPELEGRQQSLWWGKDEATDERVRREFGETHLAACRGELSGWAATTSGRVALIVVLDQFSRMIHRDRPEAFACDPVAAGHTQALLVEPGWSSLPFYQKAFALMPLMHAEDRQLQTQCVDRFEELVRDARPEQRPSAENFAKFAVAHRDIVERFGRYPHRNRVLARESTPEELEFLQQPGSSF